MSGAGRSQAADNLEDLGWFVMDNLPPSLIPKVAELADTPVGGRERLALVVGTGHYHDEIVALLGELRPKLERLQILFLDASTETLVRRYDSTRRRHPFADEHGTVAEAIDAERGALEPVRAEADLVIDTSDLNVHQLRDRMLELFGDHEDAPSMRTTVMSFGYKHGLPLDVDIVLDCRFLPNPHWVEELRPLTGLDEPGGPVRARTARDRCLPRPLGAAALARTPVLCGGGQGVSDTGVRLHRGPAPIGGDRGADSRGPRATGSQFLGGPSRHRQMIGDHRVVAIGGGHGLAVTLAAIRTWTSSVTAVVTVADDGGSSGRLRRELGIIAPGDIRRCIQSLAPPGLLNRRSRSPVRVRRPRGSSGLGT